MLSQDAIQPRGSHSETQSFGVLHCTRQKLGTPPLELEPEFPPPAPPLEPDPPTPAPPLELEPAELEPARPALPELEPPPPSTSPPAPLEPLEPAELSASAA